MAIGVLMLILCLVTYLAPVNTQNAGVPHYLSSTFFGNTNRIAVPKIPNSISEPALNAPAFLPFQGSLSQPQSPVKRPFGTPFPNVGGVATLGLQQQPQFVQFSPAQINPNVGGSLGASFTNLGQSAAEGIQQQPTPVHSSPTQVTPQRLGKAIESAGRASFNQFGPGPEGPQSSLQDSIGKALDQASRSSQFSFPPNESPVLRESGANFVPQGITRQGPVSGFPQRQQLNLERKPSSPIPSTFNQLGNTISPGPVSEPQSSSPVPDSFNQSRSGSGTGESQSSLQESLGQALDQASKSASFSLSQNTSPGPGPAQGRTSFRSPSLTRPGFSQGSQNGFPQRLGSPSSQGPPSTGSDLEQALTKASDEAAGRAGPRNGAQFSNIGPAIPAVPSGGASSKPLLEEINLGVRSPGSFGSSGSSIFRENSASRSSPLIPTQSNGSPSFAQSGQPLVFDATPPRKGFDRRPFRSDPKISGQRIQQSGSPASSKIFLGSTSLSDSSLSSGSAVHQESTPRKTCTKTFSEECRNEYKMVCEETFTEREKHECKIVEETVCEQGHTTEYEPACFQQILENCENICKHGIQPDCMPQCARSLGKTSCHKVKVVTPHTTCTKVPKEVCGNVKKRVPYEKCHDVPKKICKQVPHEVCN